MEYFNPWGLFCFIYKRRNLEYGEDICSEQLQRKNVHEYNFLI